MVSWTGGSAFWGGNMAFEPLGFGSWDPHSRIWSDLHNHLEQAASWRFCRGGTQCWLSVTRCCHRRDSATPFLSSTFGIPSCSTKVAWLNNCLRNDVASDQNDNCVVCLLPHGLVRDMDMDD
jgi:hypothetical protein